MIDIINQKNILRKKIFETRKFFDEDLQFGNTEIIAQNLIKLIKSLLPNNNSTDVIGLYYPIKGEPNLLKLIFLINKQFALPIISNDELEYVRYAPGDQLTPTGFKELYQPTKQSYIVPNIVIVPGLAFSISGYRLGFGKGHYDKYFKKAKSSNIPVSIGVCFHDKLTEHLPFNENDHKFDHIVTEKILITI